jgi:phosphohistidine phosphatase
MRVILFRHGPAGSRDASRWPNDEARPLTPKGSERTELAARGLVRLEGSIRVILTSPLERARQSAQLLHDVLESDAVIGELEALEPGGSYREVLQRLASLEGEGAVALVGHEPDLGKLAGVLLFGAPASTLPLKKAGACIIDFDGPPRPGEGDLNLFLPPRVLRRLGRTKSKV